MVYSLLLGRLDNTTYMKALMNLEPSGTGVLLVAVWMLANERFEAGVGELVRLQVAFGNELLAALLAPEGSLARMRPHVSL